MSSRWNLMLTVGAISVVALSFFSTLQILNYMDDSALPKSSGSAAPLVAFSDIVNALDAGQIVIVRFDDNPAEDRNTNGRIVCGAEATKGYLGIFVPGQRYEIKYDLAKGSWTTSGPHRAVSFDDYTETCGNYSETYGRTKLGSINARPEAGQLILWGAVMTFDTALEVFDSAKRKVGRVSLKR
jgi:hypothetical protein